MRFIHTSDWQIGKAFRLVDEETLPLLRAERLEAISRIGQLAEQHGASAVLVAGDVYDVASIGPITLRQPVERMRQFPKVEWHLIPGNHDAHTLDGPWGRLLAAGVPDNVHIHTQSVPRQIAQSSAWVLPAVLTQRHSVSDPTAGLDVMETPAGHQRIGLAHGSVRSFGSTAGSTNNLIAIDRARRANLAYLALGDWHGAQRIDERTWYSGTPEPDGFQLGGGGGGSVLLVELETGDAAPVVTELQTGRFLWREESASLQSAPDVTALEARLRNLTPDLSRVLLRLAVKGALDLAARQQFETAIRLELGSALRTLLLDDAELMVQPSAADLESIDHLGFVRVAAERLATMARDPSHAKREVAAIALQRLYLLQAHGEA